MADVFLPVLNAHNWRRREHGIEFEEVLPAVEFLAALTKRQESIRFVQGSRVRSSCRSAPAAAPHARLRTDKPRRPRDGAGGAKYHLPAEPTPSPDAREREPPVTQGSRPQPNRTPRDEAAPQTAGATRAWQRSVGLDRHHVIAAPILRVRRASLATTDKLRLNRQLNSASGVALKSGDGGYRFGYNPADCSNDRTNHLPRKTQKTVGDPLSSNPPVIHKGRSWRAKIAILLGKWLLRLDSNQQPSG